MRHPNRFIILHAAMPILLAACQPVDVATDTVQDTTGGKAVVNISIDPFEYMPFDTRSVVSVGDVCNRLTLALFNADGEKTLNKSQESKDSNFGHFTATLAPGTYILVTVGHNGTGNCTISSPKEIKFTNNKMTDTFSVCDTFTVAEGEQDISLKLKRRVAMFRLVLNDVVPSTVTQLKFYYIGGSSTLDATTGFGCVQSKQTEYRDVPAEAHKTAGSTYDIYTLPHEPKDNMKVTITALAADESIVAERTLNDVAISPELITQYNGTIFSGSTQSQGMNITFTADDTWTLEEHDF